MRNSCPEAVNKNIFLMCISLEKFRKTFTATSLIGSCWNKLQAYNSKEKKEKTPSYFPRNFEIFRNNYARKRNSYFTKKEFSIKHFFGKYDQIRWERIRRNFFVQWAVSNLSRCFMLQLGTYLGPCKSRRCSFFEKDKFKKPFTIFTKKLHHKYLIRSYTRL